MSSYFNHAREPVNSFTHFIGAALSVFGTFLLVFGTLQDPAFSVRILAGGLVFGLSLVALYSASSLYHYVNCPAQILKRLRKLDHAMIYVLIAGTYTPIFLRFSQGQAGVRLCAAMWGIALAGIILKVLWMEAPRWLSTLLYVAMGWAIVFDPSTLRSMPGGCIALIAAGGLAYTAGAVIYGVKKPNLLKRLGFHELFHLFVLLGSLLHFLAIYQYVI
ncbi:MAG: hemolysin III family protein [Provencibacterium sp.]|jgi:hemolysin III|nr:hemolysin III family protein [Provencibacterium sp.]